MAQICLKLGPGLLETEPSFRRRLMNLDKPGPSLEFVMKLKTRGVSPGLGLVVDISHGSSIYYDYNNNTFIQSCKHTHNIAE